MTIPEAAQLVLQTMVLGQGGEVFILDMGEPVGIVDLATDLIRLSGLHPERDIQLVYTGVRPGEKLCEDLFLDTEDYKRTTCSKIFVANCASTVEPEMLEWLVSEIVELAKATGSQRANEQIRTLLPEICRHLENYLPQPGALPPGARLSEPATKAPTPPVVGATVRAASTP
jgi:FlaA1/EpsC-like NDP-sugar epimerase